MTQLTYETNLDLQRLFGDHDSYKDGLSDAEYYNTKTYYFTDIADGYRYAFAIVHDNNDNCDNNTYDIGDVGGGCIYTALSDFFDHYYTKLVMSKDAIDQAIKSLHADYVAGKVAKSDLEDKLDDLDLAIWRWNVVNDDDYQIPDLD